MQWPLAQRSIVSVLRELLTARQGEDISGITTSAKEAAKLQEIGEEGELLVLLHDVDCGQTEGGLG